MKSEDVFFEPKNLFYQRTFLIIHGFRYNNYLVVLVCQKPKADSDNYVFERLYAYACILLFKDWYNSIFTIG